MAKKIQYYTIEEKREMAKQGINVPIQINHTSDKNRNGFISKIRSIHDGSRKNKRIKL